MELSLNLVFSQDSVLASGYWTMWLSSWDQGLEILGFQGPGLATCRHWSALHRRSQPLHFPEKNQQQGLIVPGKGQRRAKGFDKFQDFEHNMGHDSLVGQATAACDNLEWQCSRVIIGHSIFHGRLFSPSIVATGAAEVWGQEKVHADSTSKSCGFTT